MTKDSAKNSPSGAERRKHKRRPVLATFSMFAVAPQKGILRLPVDDISEAGIGFCYDVEGENAADFPLKINEPLEIRLYLNQSLYLPLHTKVVRIEEKDALRHVGATFSDKTSNGFKAFSSFLEMLDKIVDAALIEPPTG